MPRAGDADDRVGRLLDAGIGDRVDADVALSVVRDGLHGRLHSWLMRLGCPDGFRHIRVRLARLRRAVRGRVRSAAPLTASSPDLARRGRRALRRRRVGATRAPPTRPRSALEDDPYAWDGPRLGRVVAGRRGADAARPRDRLPRLPRGRGPAGRGRRRGVAGQRLPRVPRRERGRARLARPRAPAARPAPRGPRARLAGAQRGLLRARRARRRRGGSARWPSARRGSGASTASPTSRRSGSPSRASARWRAAASRRACACSTRPPWWPPARTCSTPLSQGWALCYLITACDGVGDFPRAAQWCQ